MTVISELYGEREIQTIFCESQLISILTEKEDIKYKRKVFKKGEYFNTGNRIENAKVYYILKGIISVENTTNILYFTGPKHFVGLEHFMLNSPLSMELNPLSSVTLLEFEKEDILFFLMGLQEGWLYNCVINHNIMVKLMKNNKNLRLCPVLRGVELVKELLPEFSEIGPDITIVSKFLTYKILRKYLNIGYTAMERVVKALEEENIYFGYKNAYKK